MPETTKELLPQAGTSNSSESRPELSGYPTDSEGGNLTSAALFSVFRRKERTVSLGDIGSMSPFAVRSSLISRSPPQTIKRKEKKREAMDTGKPEQQNSNETPTRAASKERLHLGSPIQKFIAKARSEEEEELTKCMEIVRKMQQVAGRQRNTSAEIKKSILLLEESLEVIASVRKSWTSAESRRKNQESQARDGNGDQSTPAGPSQQVPFEKGPKRPASSPASVAANLPKKQKEAAPNDGWIEVRSKKDRRPLERANPAAQEPGKQEMASSQRKRKKRGRRSKPKHKLDALLIKPAQGKSFAEVLREIRSQAKPEESGTEVRAIRQTRAGHVLLELGSTKDKSAFHDALQNILDDKAEVSYLEQKETLEIRDLDSLTTKEEVAEAIKRDLKEPAVEPQVFVTKENRWGQKAAIVQLGTKHALQLIKAQHIRIGWVRCRVRKRAVVVRCFKCLNFGHTARTCEGPDRSKFCYKCGGDGHVAKSCPAAERCLLCVERNLEQVQHTAGTGRCTAFRTALEKAKKNLK